MKTKIIDSRNIFSKPPSAHIIISPTAVVLKINVDHNYDLPFTMIGRTSLEIFFKAYIYICYMLFCCPFLWKSECRKNLQHSFFKLIKHQNLLLKLGCLKNYSLCNCLSIFWLSKEIWNENPNNLKWSSEHSSHVLTLVSARLKITLLEVLWFEQNHVSNLISKLAANECRFIFSEFKQRRFLKPCS